MFLHSLEAFELRDPALLVRDRPSGGRTTGSLATPEIWWPRVEGAGSEKVEVLRLSADGGPPIALPLGPPRYVASKPCDGTELDRGTAAVVTLGSCRGALSCCSSGMEPSAACSGNKAFSLGAARDPAGPAPFTWLVNPFGVSEPGPNSASNALTTPSPPNLGGPRGSPSPSNSSVSPRIGVRTETT